MQQLRSLVVSQLHELQLSASEVAEQKCIAWKTQAQKKGGGQLIFYKSGKHTIGAIKITSDSTGNRFWGTKCLPYY